MEYVFVALLNSDSIEDFSHTKTDYFFPGANVFFEIISQWYHF